METTLYGIKVQIPDNFLTEVSIYENFSQYANEVKKAYHAYYYKASGIKEVISGSRSVIFDQYRWVASKVIGILAANGIYGVSEDEVLEKHRSFAVEKALKSMSDRAESIDNRRNKEEAYREYRKNSRGRFIGGGFGLEGAIKGMAMAGAANIATGLLHSVANAFGNAGSAIKRSMSMNSLYHSGVCGNIIKAIDNDVMGFYDVLEDIFYLNGIRRGNIPDRIAEADAIYKQLEEGTIPESAHKQAVVSMITAFPGKFEYYALAVNLIGNSNGELSRLMEKFGLDVEYFSVVEASAEWRNLVFGKFKNELTKDKNLLYLEDIRYSKWGYGIIPQLQYGPVMVVSELVSDFIQKFREEADLDNLELFTFEDSSNGYLLSLLESRNVKLALNEIPILCINIASQLKRNARTAEYLLLTTEKLYFVSKDGYVNKASVQNITKIRFYDDYSLGTQVNDSPFAPKVNFYGSDDYLFGGLLYSIIALIQCLQSVGHVNRSAAIIEPDSLASDYDAANDMSVYFRAPIDVLFTQYEGIQKLVALPVNEPCNRCVGNMQIELEELKKELEECTDEEQKYQLTKAINSCQRNLDEEIGMVDTLIDKSEKKIISHTNYNFRALLTDKRLYLFSVANKESRKVVLELSQIHSAYYEWSYGSEAFWINGQEYSAISSDAKNGAKEFIGALYWTIHYQEEWQAYLSGKNGGGSESENGNRVSLQQALQQFKEDYDSYMTALYKGKIQALWDVAEKGEPLAEYVLKQFYEGVLRSAIKQYDLTELKSLLNVISVYATKGHPYGNYLAQKLTRKMYRENNKDGEQNYRITECDRELNRLFEEYGSCASLKADKGFRIVEGDSIDKQDGIAMLKQTAEMNHPLAMAWYGSYLYEGSHRIRKDEAMGLFYLEMAVYAGQGYAIKLNDKYDLGFNKYQGKLIQNSSEFELNNGSLYMTSFPRYFMAKYISRFNVHPKDIMFEKDGLSDSKQLMSVKRALGIATDEKVYLAVSASMMGHFKDNMNGIAICTRGIYVNGGKLGGSGFIKWDELQGKNIFIRNGLNIDNLSLSCSSMEQLLESILLDFRELTSNKRESFNAEAVVEKKVSNDISSASAQEEDTASTGGKDYQAEQETSSDTTKAEEMYYTACFDFSEYMRGLPTWFDRLVDFSQLVPSIKALQKGFISVLNVSDPDWDRMCNLQNSCSKMTENEVMLCAFDLSFGSDGGEGILITNKYVHWVYKSQAYQMKLQMAGFSNSGKASLTETIQGAGLFAVPWLFDMGNEERQSLNQMLYAVLKIANECKLED